MWLLDCLIYVAIVAWYSVNRIKCKLKKNAGKQKPFKPHWLDQLEKDVLEKRKLVSKCVAEKQRITENSRITRRTRRNRKEIEKLIGTISLYSLTKLICKLKAQVHRLAQTRKRKLKNQKARDWSNMFHNNQSQVFKQFKEMIDQTDEGTLPKFKEFKRVRKFFTNSEEVLNFWKSLWCKVDTGRPEAEWLAEYTTLLESKIPGVNGDNIEIDVNDVKNAIRKKRNWSSPGPDMIVNFWLKKLDVIYQLIKHIFSKIVNSGCTIETWYCCGRTNLIEKPGEWLFNNTRPITCTNNLYKWFTSLLQIFYNKHVKSVGFMQMDQRGAKDKCSGTMENLLIDNMVLQDAHDNKRNLSCAWVDVKKAYDSLSHSWIKRMLEIHRFPLKLQDVLGKIIDAWSVKLVIPMEKEDVISNPIKITNGVLQGDVISPNLYTLAMNPVSWELRRHEGYKLSKPIQCKITHTLFMDDLKSYAKSFNAQRLLLSDIKEKMGDASLLWNNKKCKVINIKRGEIDVTSEEMVLTDGTKLECLESEDRYKFLGVPENILHDTDDIVIKIEESIRGRANVIWSSPLSDCNKVFATNIFVYSALEYYMWSERFNISDLREMDVIIRDIMNKQNAKYSLQLNASLYLPRSKGGRGLKNFEMLYKKTKVKAAMKILTASDPRMICVKQFDEKRMNKGRSSIINDAKKYARDDFKITLDSTDNGFTVNDVGVDETNKINDVKKILNEKDVKNYVKEIDDSTWQGVILSKRYNDTELVNKAFMWLTHWKDCPVDLINEMQSIYLQTVPTLSFKKFRGEAGISSTVCRLCSKGVECVMHLLSHCEFFLKTAFKRRHDKALQLILFHLLAKHDLIDKCPEWYSKITIKPMYENEQLVLYWDIPEFSGYPDEEEEHTLRPDGKLIMKEEKAIWVLEMSVPWISNRASKFVEKEDKYIEIVQRLKIDNPGYEVKQLTFIMDVLGGYSLNLVNSLKCLKFSTTDIDKILLKMQKIVLTEATSMIRHFKIRTKR